MADPGGLLESFVAAHRAGEDPDPRAYLERLEGAERAELAILIDAYLERAPRRAFDAAGFAASRARPAAEAVTRSLAGSAGAWPVLLPRLREAARLRRDELVRRLATALGAGEQEAKVADYYHRMEQGTLPAAGVSERVLEALGAIVGAGTEALRSAGEAIEPPPRTQAAGPVFTRVAADDGAGSGAAPGRGGERGPGAERDGGGDEVDRLFTGG